jgi:hypothetical protein
MRINKLNIAIVTEYAAPYQGNFFQSIIELNKRIVEISGKLILVFSKAAKNIDWVNGLVNDGLLISLNMKVMM